MIRLVSLLLVLTVFAWPEARADSLATDLSDHEIGITSSFAGTSLLLFGTKGARWANDDLDVIVVVRGPETPMKVWRKQRIAGIWIKSEPVAFDNVPGYYAIASNRPLKFVASTEYLRKNNIGPQNLVLVSVEDVAVGAAIELRRAIIQNRREAGLYFEIDDAVTFSGGGLFRTDIHFPANVPVGDYRILILLLQDGVEVDRTSKVLSVGKQGIERQLYSFAYDRPALYGIFAVVFAVAAGWAAAFIFRSS